MRVIKFRAWDNSTKKMYYNSGLTVHNNNVIHMDGEIMQFTGLLDKNGKEIYEGDILASGERVIGHIEGGVRGYCYDVVYFKPRHDKRWSLYASVTDDYEGKVEVIGNIYETPELLSQ